jgi:hypothetical protein
MVAQAGCSRKLRELPEMADGLSIIPERPRTAHRKGNDEDFGGGRRGRERKKVGGGPYKGCATCPLRADVSC